MVYILVTTTLFLFLIRNTVSGQISNSDEECGHQAIFNKIMDGEITAMDEFPWMALLEYKNRKGKSAGFGCSGTLITKRHILTTAHCIKEMERRRLELYSVRLGEYNISSETDCVEMLGFIDCADPPQNVLTEKWAVHPQHNKHVHDVAVIKLAQDVNFTDFVRPICLPNLDDNVEVGQLLVVAGWGRTEKENISSIKLKVSVPIVPFAGCYEKYRITNTILHISQHLCAGSVLGKDACTGDSGGPLMMSRRTDGRWIVVGIISTGNSCGLEDWPGIYVRVINYREWITDVIRTL